MQNAIYAISLKLGTMYIFSMVIDFESDGRLNLNGQMISVCVSVRCVMCMNEFERVRLSFSFRSHLEIELHVDVNRSHVLCK